MSTINITKENYDAEVIKSDKPVLLDFWAPWCVPCRQMGKIVEELGSEMGTIKIGKINVEDEPELAASLGVMNIPVVICFKEGKPTGRLSGVHSKKAVIKKLLS